LCPVPFGVVSFVNQLVLPTAKLPVAVSLVSLVWDSTLLDNSVADLFSANRQLSTGVKRPDSYYSYCHTICLISCYLFSSGNSSNPGQNSMT
jgi:hypothetical protein